MNNNRLNEAKEYIEIILILEELIYSKIPQLINNELDKKNIKTELQIDLDLNVEFLRR